MDIDLIFRIAAIGILVVVVNLILKQAGREELGTMVTIAGLIIVLLMVIDLVSNLFESVKRIFNLY